MKASILLPVYNSENTIQATLNSILAQTYKDFELIIINDGSSDKSEEIIFSYNDTRIKYYANPKNQGLIYTLNRGIHLCTGEYIIRIDADDIMLPTRIEKQIHYMDKHPNVVASGSSIICFDGIHRNKLYTPPLSAKNIQYKILLGSPIPHPSSIIRKSTLDKHQIYFNKDYLHAEDYKFWYDLMKYGELTNLKEPLLKYRLSTTQISQKHKFTQQIASCRLRKEIIEDFLNKYDIKYPIEFSMNTILKYNMRLPSNSVYSTILFLFMMSLPQYNFKILISFLTSRIYLRKGFSYKYTIAFILKIYNPQNFQKFNLNLASLNQKVTLK